MLMLVNQIIKTLHYNTPPFVYLYLKYTRMILEWVFIIISSIGFYFLHNYINSNLQKISILGLNVSVLIMFIFSFINFNNPRYIPYLRTVFNLFIILHLFIIFITFIILFSFSKEILFFMNTRISINFIFLIPFFIYTSPFILYSICFIIFPILISNLPVYNFLNNSKEINSSLCSICLTDYVEGDEVKVLMCKHNFHCVCINYWIERQWTCPMCKKPLILLIKHRS